MHIPYVRKTKENRRSRWITEDGFRLLRCLPVEVNAHRFRHHLELAAKRDRRTPNGKRFAMKLRRLRRQGRSMAFVDVDVLDESGALLALGRANYAMTGYEPRENKT